MNHPTSPSRILPARRPLVYLITDRRASHQTRDNQSTGIEAQLARIKAAVDTGCQMIQIRERDLDRAQLSALVGGVIEIARPSGVLVFVNDRLDVAIETGADGVHLRMASLRPREVRSLAREKGRDDLLIGASTHSVAEATDAATDADFLVCGPIFATPSKRDFGPPIGLRVFEQVVRAVRVPVLGIGGVSIDNFREVLDCGAAGLAGIGLFANLGTTAGNVRMILGS